MAGLGASVPGSRPEVGVTSSPSVPSSSQGALRLEVTELSLGTPERSPESLLLRGAPRAAATSHPKVLVEEPLGLGVHLGSVGLWKTVEWTRFCQLVLPVLDPHNLSPSSDITTADGMRG